MGKIFEVRKIQNLSPTALLDRRGPDRDPRGGGEDDRSQIHKSASRRRKARGRFDEESCHDCQTKGEGHDRATALISQNQMNLDVCSPWTQKSWNRRLAFRSRHRKYSEEVNHRIFFKV